jgi:hypothetical protein
VPWEFHKDFANRFKTEPLKIPLIVSTLLLLYYCMYISQNFSAYMSSAPKSMRVLFLASLLLFTLAIGCAEVRYISDYDSVLDNDVTTLQQSTETFLNQLNNEVGTPQAAYSANVDFYTKADATLRTMATRASSEPKSKIILEQVQSLQKSFDDLQQLHKLTGDKGLSSANIANARSAIESQFQSILTLQLSLKSHSVAPSPTPK